MTEVKNDSNLNLDWSVFMQKLSSGQAVDGEEKVQAQKAVAGADLTVTHAGVSRPDVAAYEIPQLSEPKPETQASVLSALMTLGDKVTPATCKEITDAFNKFCRDFAAEAPTMTTTSVANSHQQTMFDIYALLRLLQDVGQTLKLTAREAREAALQADMALIKSEAAIQRHAAIVGFAVTVAVSAAMCTASVVCSVANISKSKSAYNKQKAASKASTAPKNNPSAKMKENVADNKAKVQDANNGKNNDIKKQEDGQKQEMQDLSEKNDLNKENALNDKQNANAGQKKEEAQSEREILEDEAFKLGQSAGLSSTLSMAFLTLGQGMGGIGQSIQQIMSTEGTLLEADQKKAEALRDEMNEVMQDAQAVISAVKDLRESIIQSESQSIDTILRA